jgi:hypothetical protein
MAGQSRSPKHVSSSFGKPSTTFFVSELTDWRIRSQAMLRLVSMTATTCAVHSD